MIVNKTISIIIAIIVAYLLGSIPFAYIFTRLGSGRDIRQLGSVMRSHNVFREVGLKIAIPVALFDVSKGAARYSSPTGCLAYLYANRIFSCC